jgi:hypothetical protein
MMSAYEYDRLPSADNKELISMTATQQHVVANFLLRSWFSRLWTLQEVLLPTKKLSLCGSREVDISIPAMFASTILRNNRTICENVRPGQVEVSIRRLGAAASVIAWMGCTLPAGGFGERAFLRYHKIDYKLTIPRTYKWLVALELLVHEARQRECSKAKDRIIAPLAFALHEKFLPDREGFRGVEIEIQRIISGCQSISTEELYCKFTHFMISKMGNLDILSRAHGDQDTDLELDLPSWVPPFHTAGSTSLIDELLVTQYDAAKHLGKRSEGNPPN